MTTFEQRERAFEAKYAHDEELRFRMAARRDKLFARWAAEQLHLSELGAAELTNAILIVKDGPGHDERLLDMVQQTFRDHGVQDTGTLRPALQRCADQARAELLDRHFPPTA